ncbi:MAG: V-type ATP synthase subunit E [Candidatus Hodarchaeota archaeon]
MTRTNHFENEILQDAKQQAKNILLEAEHEAREILDQARGEKERIIQAKLVEIEKEEEQRVQRELSKLRIKNKIELNNVKAQLLDKIFTKSLERIQEWKDTKSEEYRSALEHQIIQGGISLEGGELKVKLAPEDVSLIDIKSLESKITNECGITTSIKISASENDEFEGGSIISKGLLAVQNTIEARLDRQEEALRDEIHRILFIS